MDILTTSTTAYMNVFVGYLSQFTTWGKWIFFSLLTMNLVWMFVWYAFDKESLLAGLSSFIKKFVVICIFFTIMVNPEWMVLVLKSVQSMGSQLTHAPIDPSSILSEGLGIGNKMLIPLQKSSLWQLSAVSVLILLAYVIVLFCFINVALELAVTLIVTMALISIATFFLGFAGLGATSQVARNTLDVILANCMKILGIYLVVASSNQAVSSIISLMPSTVSNPDPYVMIVTIAVLFLLIAKVLPNQLASIFSGVFRESKGVDAASMAMTAMSIGSQVMPAMKLAGSAVQTIGQIAGSTGYNAAGHFKASMAEGAGLAASMGAAVAGSMGHLGKASGSLVADHFKNVSSKMTGGEGVVGGVKGVSERMNQAGRALHEYSKSDAGGRDVFGAPKKTVRPSFSSSQPNSSGLKSAGPSSLRSKKK